MGFRFAPTIHPIAFSRHSRSFERRKRSLSLYNAENLFLQYRHVPNDSTPRCPVPRIFSIQRRTEARRSSEPLSHQQTKSPTSQRPYYLSILFSSHHPRLTRRASHGSRNGQNSGTSLPHRPRHRLHQPLARRVPQLLPLRRTPAQGPERLSYSPHRRIFRQISP